MSQNIKKYHFKYNCIHIGIAQILDFQVSIDFDLFKLIIRLRLQILILVVIWFQVELILPYVFLSYAKLIFEVHKLNKQTLLLCVHDLINFNMPS